VNGFLSAEVMILELFLSLEQKKFYFLRRE